MGLAIGALARLDTIERFDLEDFVWFGFYLKYFSRNISEKILFLKISSKNFGTKDKFEKTGIYEKLNKLKKTESYLLDGHLFQMDQMFPRYFAD